jgi:hypothetical protein
MNFRHALLLLALSLTACAERLQEPKPIPAVPEQRQCPAFPLAPADLLKPPVKTDFLSKTP